MFAICNQTGLLFLSGWDRNDAPVWTADTRKARRYNLLPLAAYLADVATGRVVSL